ncbi:cytochrome P450 monooxygenase pc-3 [Fistulina hepatica ATCC 64428]|uniref:Cytochrome P450 monooxygenase pc-3 n=1 Tax=Fistulina hepatica ATCC 64428 TaxID=1128425 RepID=A0A0D7A0X5_9AGAR|nr:cytochrome P450 monooxygenase pc-3 [Fistulina hepatica ATCC 64428]
MDSSFQAAVPPGIRYLVPRLPLIVVPFGTVYLALGFLETALDAPIAAWLRALAYIACLPGVLTINVIHEQIALRHKAKAFDAVLPPLWNANDPTPGGLRTITQMLRNQEREYPGDLLQKTFRELGPTIRSRVFFVNRTITTEPQHVKALLATQFDEFEKGKTLNRILGTLLGVGVFASDGAYEFTRFHRTMTRPFFSRDRISHFDNFDRHAEDALYHLRDRLREGLPADIQACDLTGRFTLDSATEFLFGNDVQSLSAGLPYPHNSPLAKLKANTSTASQFAQAFNLSQKATAERSRWNDQWPLFELFHDKVKQHSEIVDRYIDPIVREALARKREQGGLLVGQEKEREVEDGETLLDHLVNCTDDMHVIRDETLNILIAGRDTTATTLTFAVYLLAQHPEVLRRLREEILSKLGSSRRPVFEDFRDMKYLRAVINETLRLYPAVPFNIRVLYSVFLMHRRKDLWGPDAEEFDPDRFIDERLQKYLTPNPFIFMPFNAGPRICLGQQFAYHEASFFLVRLLQRFSAISLAPEAQPPEFRPPGDWASAGGRKAKEQVMMGSHLTMYIRGGLWVRMEEAEAKEEI